MANKPYSNLECPLCGVKGDFARDNNEEVFCIHCGLVIESPYPYSAGIRFKTLEDILLDIKMKELKRRENDRIKKF